MKKPVFITLEGIDGSGKSTHLKRLTDALNELGHKVYPTFEPTNGMIGSLLRKILKGEIKKDERIIAGLFATDRLDHILDEENGLLKKQREGYSILSDRFYFSSYAYNGAHMDMQWVINANAMSVSLLKPDLHLFIDVPPEVSMQRLHANRAGTELYESLENLTRVRTIYFEAFDLMKASENIAIINGNQSPDKVFDEIWQQVSPLL